MAREAKSVPLGRAVRFFEVDRAAINKEKRTIPVTFSTETPVDRGNYHEILDHAAADMSRLKDSAPVLLSHNAYDGRDQIGVVESADITDKTGRAVLRFGNSTLATEIFQDVQDGIRKHVSVGYARSAALSRTKDEQGRDVIRFAWQPLEISIVPIPADPNTGVGRAALIDNDPIAELMKRNLLFAPDAAEGGTATATAPAAEPKIDRAAVILEAQNAEKKRFRDINAAADAIAKEFPTAGKDFRDLANKAIEDGTSTENFNAQLLGKIPGVRQAEKTDANIGMTEKDLKGYSFTRGIQTLFRNLTSDRKETCPEFDQSRQVEKVTGLRANGFFVPFDVLAGCGVRGQMMQRDSNVTTGSQGGNFVQTTIVTPIIELLRNRMVAIRLGVQTLSGLQGNVAIPRQTGAATAYSVSEQAAITKSTQAINQQSLSPKRVGAWNNYSKQLLLQSSVDVENFIRDDLMKVLAIYIDKMILEGSGSASQPTGIVNTSSIGTITFGAAATWAKILSMETKLALSNADIGRMAYVSTPTTRGVLKAAVKIASSTVPSFIWENGFAPLYGIAGPDYGTGTSNDGIINGYRAAATNQLASDYMLFGNFEDAILGMWGGFDVTVDPYSIAETGTVRIVVNAFIDVAVRHAASFCVSTDSAAQ